MAIVNGAEATVAQYKAVFQANVDNIKNTGELISNIFEGDWEGVKEDLLDYKLPILEGAKAQKENIEQQQAEGKKTIIDIVKGWFTND